MSVSVHAHDGVATISISGNFNFAVNSPFRECMQKALATPELQGIDVSLYEATYADSSALGMLLVLRDHAHAQGVTQLRIVGARGTVQQVLNIARFEKFYTIG
ncbi:STAS domain-containing protein [Chitinimonas sp. BJB300]|uniref:STAS domain-containing protein n=1 Tax=Chitinimonas sp. BJB300 TaxID=1559339 RepID=UPI000C0CF7EF|nr:STAS domain-containing protein [Chitinimonas sp. BJB300]PHV10992.1 anti-anti-sigma factor [Chitinimonas sp. BJB300]TSJ87548.1 STAS domain-containing protein [Chitinimonas sp. BJB300]